MKKKYLFLIPAMLMICVLFLSGCNSQMLTGAPQIPDLDGRWTMTAKIEDGDFTCTAALTRGSSSEWTAEFIEPFALQGMKLSLSEGALTAVMGEFTSGIYPDCWDSSPLGDLISAFELGAADKENASVSQSEDGEGNVLTKVCGDGYALDFENGKLTGISAGDVKAIISDFHSAENQ